MREKIIQPTLFFLLLLITPFAHSQGNGDEKGEVEQEATKDSLLPGELAPVVDMLDSMALSVYYEKDPFVTDSGAVLDGELEELDSFPSFPDSVYEARLDSIDRLTPLSFEYNEVVQAFIDLYANKRRDLTSRMLGMKEIYFPMIEEELDKENIPLEIKYLAIVESALNPTARSPAGATGIWQFMYRTGKLYDLEIGSYVDERMDPVASTRAACEYLSFLHGIYEDWDLVLAAYNAGPGRVNRAMRRAGGKKGYWELRPYLPRETRGYVPAFVAVNYIANFYEEHGIVPTDPGYRYFEFDSVHVKEPVSFDQISKALGVGKDTLKILNPIYRRDEVPATDDHKALRLPVSAIGRFIAQEDSIYNMDESPVDEDGFVTEEITRIHRVKRGEYLGSIAQKYGVGISQIRAWNGLHGSRIHPGQRLTIHKTVRRKVEDEKEDDASADAEENNTEAAQEEMKEQRYHTVQPGDTLWDIARKYNGVTMDKIRSLNEEDEIRQLKPGQRILIDGPS